jgi:acetate kinase
MSRAFVVNSGSSSIKFQVIDLDSETVVEAGALERIGQVGGDAPSHAEGMRAILDRLGNASAISVVGHRVVHGGQQFTDAALVTDAVLDAIESLSPLAPLHNPANLIGIRAAREVLPAVPHVAVFDTAFHQTLPAEAYTYAIDSEIASRYGIRRYGFHGSSHKFVSERAAEFLNKPLSETNLIVLHLGNGSSVTAIDGGRSVDTSMGFTPLPGLVMGTRSGDIDPAIVFHLHREAGMAMSDIDDMVNSSSGMLGLTGCADMRDVEEAITRGDERARIGLGVWRHRVRHYIGAYVAQLGRVDALVFTAGIGENSFLLREMACQGLEHLGIILNHDRNEASDRTVRDIGAVDSSVRILVVPTNEELEIARQAAAVIHNSTAPADE